jgi:hypothetical protein
MSTLTTTLSTLVFIITIIGSTFLTARLTDWTMTQDTRVWITVYLAALDAVKVVCFIVILHVLAF